MVKPKILFIEDCIDLQQAVCSALANEYEMHTAMDAERGLTLLHEIIFDLIIIDLGLPTMNGYKLCTIIRAQEKTARVPVIIYSGNLDVEDKLMGFSIGANDYFTKPGDLRELKARIQIQLKEAQKEKSKKQIEIGPFQLDLIKQSVYFRENGKTQTLDFSTLEFRVFHYFLTHIDHVISREQLLNQVWGNARHVNDRSVDAVISKLRSKLNSHAVLIQSVHGTGYRCINPQILNVPKHLKKVI